MEDCRLIAVVLGGQQSVIGVLVERYMFCIDASHNLQGQAASLKAPYCINTPTCYRLFLHDAKWVDVFVGRHTISSE